MTYEYKMVPARFQKLYNGQYTTTELDPLGTSGWLLSQTVYLDGNYYFILVRTKEE
jgi:hypothetical protein